MKTQYFVVVWPDGSQTDPFTNKREATAYAKAEGAKVEGEMIHEIHILLCRKACTGVRGG